MSECEVTEGGPVRVFDLTASPDPVSDAFSVSSPISQLNCCASQALSFCEMRSASGMMLCELSKRARYEQGRTTSQNCAEGGQEQTHAAKCAVQSSACSTSTRWNAAARKDDVAWSTVGSTAFLPGVPSLLACATGCSSTRRVIVVRSVTPKKK